jgi:hypothetical protein
LASIINHHVVFECVCCGTIFSRPVNSSDYIGRIDMPNGWGYSRIGSDFNEFCSNLKCQEVLNACTVGYQIDNITDKTITPICSCKPKELCMNARERAVSMENCDIHGLIKSNILRS